MTKAYWYLTKGALGKWDNSKLRAFPQRPNDGPYIVEINEAGTVYLFDDNENFLKAIPYKEAKSIEDRKIMATFIEEELNRLNFERPSTRTSYSGNKKKLSSRMMEPEDYEYRKIRVDYSKAKRKPVKKCKCK
jgi:hypothetical protein